MVITMIQKVIKIGNSIGIIIPQVLNKDVGLQPGDEVSIEKKKINSSKNKKGPSRWCFS
jgi:antitoxin component of MazEF toxin-antitoxin module